MAEIIDQESVLNKISNFKPLWRLLLATPGTLQSTLTAYFGSPVSVQVVGQSIEGNVISRRVNLVCDDREIVVCRATTEITVDDPRINEMVNEKRVGIGQIIQLLGAKSEFRLEETGQVNGSFWRRYTLSGPGYCFNIREDFPKILYADIHHDGA
jgi:chorismate-pyruvate lyase